MRVAAAPPNTIASPGEIAAVTVLYCPSDSNNAGPVTIRLPSPDAPSKTSLTTVAVYEI